MRLRKTATPRGTPAGPPRGRHFQLPRSLDAAGQTWLIACRTHQLRRLNLIVVKVLLADPLSRFRFVRIELDQDLLLAGRYDARRALREIAAWLPQSDPREELRLGPSALLREP